MTVVIRVRKFLHNKLLSRKQMVVDVIHTNEAGISKEKVREMIAKKYKVDERNIICFGFKTVYGGGKTTGFCLIYNNYQYLLKYEPKYRLRLLDILPKPLITRKGKKELKGKCKKTRGKAITKLKGGKIVKGSHYRRIIA